MANSILFGLGFVVLTVTTAAYAMTCFKLAEKLSDARENIALLEKKINALQQANDAATNALRCPAAGEVCKRKVM